MAHPMTVCLLMVLGAQVPEVESHWDGNPLFRELCRSGVVIDGRRVVTLPSPSMPDGLDHKAQLSRIEAIPQRRLPVDRLMRRAIAAPLIVSVGPLSGSESGVRFRSVDLYFIAYGDVELAASEGGGRDLTMSDQGRVHVLSPEELAARNIAVAPPVAQRTTFAHTIVSVLDRVELAFTSRTVHSRTAESLVIASRLEPGFRSDEQFPNRWRSIDGRSRGKEKLGPPEPYLMHAHYMKVTKLREPRDGLFVELHVAFEQPEGWFGGADLLHSKLRIGVQTGVRSFRRELKRQAAKTAPKPPRR